MSLKIREISLPVAQYNSVPLYPPVNAEDMGSIPDLGGSTTSSATKLVSHSYGACALEPGSHGYGAQGPRLLKAMCPRPVHYS